MLLFTVGSTDVVNTVFVMAVARFTRERQDWFVCSGGRFALFSNL
jgi:hypothetical protein